MFVNGAFHRHLGQNPFGHSALDIKALAMGVAGIGWADTSYSALAARYGLDAELPHHALEDARLQARLFAMILAERQGGTHV
jgi:DNA polymerase III epsilon subunit-like protein